MLGAVGVLAAGAVIAGVTGVVVFAAAIAIGYLVDERRYDRLTLTLASVPLILAGAVLSPLPVAVRGRLYRALPWVQLLALISIGALAASALPRIWRRSVGENDASATRSA